MGRTRPRRVLAWSALAVVLIGLTGCSLLFGGGSAEEPTPVAEDRVLVPTFTPTPEVPATATPEPVSEPAEVVVAPASNAPAGESPAESPTAAPVTEPTIEAPTATPIPKLVVSAPSANARNGPGTEYGLAGAVTQNQAFDAIGKNAEGTWWQFCCVNGQQAWIFGELVNVENGDSVQVAQNIPAPRSRRPLNRLPRSRRLRNPNPHSQNLRSPSLHNLSLLSLLQVR